MVVVVVSAMVMRVRIMRMMSKKKNEILVSNT